MLSKQRIGPDTARHHQTFQPGLRHGSHGFFDQHIHNGGLRGGRQVSLAGVQVVAQLFGLCQHRRLQSGKGKIEVATVQQRSGQLESCRVTVLGQPGKVGPPRVRQPHELGRLVKSLASRIVDAFAKQFIAAHAVNLHQLRMTTGHQQRYKRKLWRVRTQKRRQQMAFQVVHTHHRLADGGRDGTCHASPHQQGTRQAGTSGVGHHIHVRQHQPGRLDDLTRQRQNALNVVTACQFRHHAAVSLVHVDLAVQGMRQQTRRFAAGRVDNSHTGFVAT